MPHLCSKSHCEKRHAGNTCNRVSQTKSICAPQLYKYKWKNYVEQHDYYIDRNGDYSYLYRIKALKQNLSHTVCCYSKTVEYKQRRQCIQVILGKCTLSVECSYERSSNSDQSGNAWQRDEYHISDRHWEILLIASHLMQTEMLNHCREHWQSYRETKHIDGKLLDADCILHCRQYTFALANTEIFIYNQIDLSYGYSKKHRPE